MKQIYLFFLCLPFISIAQIENSVKDSRKFIEDGVALHDEKKYDEAIAEFKKVNRNDTNYALALYELANSYVAMEKDSLAVIVCDEALKMRTIFTPNFILYKANALDNMKKSDEAIKLYEEGMAKYPYNSSFYHELAVLKYKKEKYKEAHDLLVKALKLNPYHAASHNLMANLAIKQGKLIPAMLAWQFYLISDNSSMRAKQIIVSLEKLAKNEYEFENSVRIETLSEQDNFSELESLVKSKIALSGKYKSKIKLDFDLVKQMNLIVEKLEVDKADQGFYMQFYAPFFVELYKSKNFEAFVYGILSNMGVEKVNAWNKKNKSKSDAMSTWLVKYISDNYCTIDTEINGEKMKMHTWFSSSRLSSIGNMDAAGNTVGYWRYFYYNGVTRSEGVFDNQGKKAKQWKYYEQTGILKDTESFVDGLLEGSSDEYYEDGSLMAKKNYSKGLLDGKQYLYYPTGIVKNEYDYSAGKLSGVEKAFHENGKLKYEAKLVNSSYEGEIIQYHASGNVMSKSTYAASIRIGHFTDYHDIPGNVINSEGEYVKNLPIGEWKFYHENGKLKTVGSYNSDGYKNGVWKTYDKNGTLTEEETFTDGNYDATSKYYDDEGGLTEEYVYKKGTLQEYKAYDGKGKKIFENKKDGKDNYDVTLYHPNGNKKREGRVNKGVLEGIWNEYNVNGYLTGKAEYVQGKKQNKSMDYFSNSAISSTIEYPKEMQSIELYKQYYINGKLQREGAYIGDNRNGEWRDYFPDGKLSSILYYVDGNLKGWQQYYAANGKLDYEEFIELDLIKKRIYYDTTTNILQVINFEKGNGPIELIYPNGKIKVKGSFKNGKLNGSYISYFPNGKIRSMRSFVDDNLEGELKYYYPNGKTENEYMFVNDLKHGKVKYYYENGNLRREIDYVKGKMEGKDIFYFENKQTEKINENKDDNLEGKSTLYAETGDIQIERTFKKDHLVQYTYLDKTGNKVTPIEIKNATGTIKAYFKNGNPSIEYTIVNSELEGKRTTYHFNGKIESVEYFHGGKQDSTSNYYYPSGVLKETGYWVMNHRHGKFVTYYENGKIEKEESYFNDTRHGPSNYYDQTGKLIKSYLFYDGELFYEN